MSVQFPNPESNPCPHGSSNGGLGGCVIVGGGVGEPPNRQCTALLNQGIDLLNHDIASKTLSGVKLELAWGVSDFLCVRRFSSEVSFNGSA